MRKPFVQYILGLAFGLALSLGISPEVHASAFGDDNFADFAGAEEVLDNELSTQRGGFLDVNGMLVSFTFTASATVNGVSTGQEFYFDDQMAQAVLDGKEQSIDPIIVQNTLADATIAVKAQFDMEVVGGISDIADLSIRQSLASQAAFQDMMVLY